MATNSIAFYPQPNYGGPPVFAGPSSGCVNIGFTVLSLIISDGSSVYMSSDGTCKTQYKVPYIGPISINDLSNSQNPFSYASITNTNTISFYSQPNYGGTNMTINVNSIVLGLTPVGFTVLSLKVPQGTIVNMYAVYKQSNEQYVAGSYPNIDSSVAGSAAFIYNAGDIICYPITDYMGEPVTFPPFPTSTLTSVTLAIASISVPEYSYIDVYTNSNGTSSHVRINGPSSIPDYLQWWWNPNPISYIDIYVTDKQPLAKLITNYTPVGTVYTIPNFISLIDMGGYPNFNEVGVPVIDSVISVTLSKPDQSSDIQAALYGMRAFFSPINTLNTVNNPTFTGSTTNAVQSMFISFYNETPNLVYGIAPYFPLDTPTSDLITYSEAYNRNENYGDIRYSVTSKDNYAYLSRFRCPVIGDTNGQITWANPNEQVDHLYSPEPNGPYTTYNNSSGTTKFNGIKCIYDASDFQTIDDIQTFIQPQQLNNPINSLPYMQWDNIISDPSGVNPSVQDQVNNIILPVFCSQPATSGTCNPSLIDPKTKKPTKVCSRFQQVGTAQNPDNTGATCTSWAKANPSLGDQAKLTYCSNYPTSPDCQCLYPQYDPEYKKAKGTFLTNPQSNISPVCWLTSCLTPSEYLVLENTGVTCPKAYQLCEQINKFGAGGNVIVDQLSQQLNCTSSSGPSGGTTPPSSSDKWIIPVIIIIVVIVLIVILATGGFLYVRSRQ